MSPARKEPDLRKYSGKFAEHLHTLRVRSGLSVIQAAKLLRVNSRHTVYQWEDGRNQPPLDMFPFFAIVYGLENIGDLLPLAEPSSFINESVGLPPVWRESDTMTYSKRFAFWLRELRACRGWTVAQAVEEMGLKKTNQLYSWEIARSSPPIDMFPVFAQVYGLKRVGDILPRVELPQSDTSVPEEDFPPGDCTTRFGVRLREVRERAGFSQKSAAELLGIEISTLQSWESGEQDPSMDALSTIVRAYRLTSFVDLFPAE